MLLTSFRVFHLAKGQAFSGVIPATLSRAFHLDSCQRRVWVTVDPTVEVPTAAGLEVFEAEAGYEFLLRVACGLESQVIGETDIFGQLKEAWRVYANGAGVETEELQPWFQKLFEDTKEIRTRFLQSAGGSTYGSLVRRILPAKLSGPVLLIGAGRLALDIAPYLAHYGLEVVNRNSDHRDALAQATLGKCPAASVQPVDAADEAAAWGRAGAVVLCVPFLTREDENRMRLASGKVGPAPVLHLGGLRAEAGAWAGIPGVSFLDALFALDKRQGDLRKMKTERAFRACAERAKLRKLGSSVSIPHGWEDLALFA